MMRAVTIRGPNTIAGNSRNFEATNNIANYLSQYEYTYI
jgi:hypothetical protein